MPTAAAFDAVATLVLVEGDSDAAALQALAGLIGLDLARRGLRIHPAHGITNFPRVLREFLQARPGARCCGLYDVADARHVRRALVETGLLGTGLPAGPALEACGFFACETDLEAELIRALGPEAVQRVIEAEGELASFRRLQAMPEHRDSPVERQLHRFLGTRATRKIRAARRLVEALDPAALPRPLARLAARMQAATPA